MARPKKAVNKGGRPSKMNDEILRKLEHGFKIGLNDLECCCYADIPSSTFYDYQKAHPEFSEQKAKWKQTPIAKAKNTIFKNLDDPKTAQWYLERKCKDEFSTKIEQDIRSMGINIVVADKEHQKMLEEL